MSITHCTLYNVQCTYLSWYAKSLRYNVYSLVVQDQNPKKLCVHWKGTLFSWKLNFSARSCYRVHTEWQWPLFDVHFIMMAKSAQPGEGGGVHTLPLLLYLPSRARLCVRSSWEGRCTPPISPLPLYVLCGSCLSGNSSLEQLYS